jgi:hypothetical protein
MVQQSSDGRGTYYLRQNGKFVSIFGVSLNKIIGGVEL